MSSARSEVIRDMIVQRFRYESRQTNPRYTHPQFLTKVKQNIDIYQNLINDY